MLADVHLWLSEELELPLKFDDKIPHAHKMQRGKQIAAYLRALRGYIPGIRSHLLRYSRSREGRKILIRPAAYKVDEKVLLRAVQFHNAGTVRQHSSIVSMVLM
jgi:hypothetical protein